MSLYYAQVNIINLLFLFITYVTMSQRSQSLTAARLVFNRMLFTIAVMSVFDIFAWCFNGSDLPGTPAFLQISNIVYYGAITWCGYEWLNYVDIRVRDMNYNFGKRRRLTAIPLIIMLAFLVTNPFTELLFYVDENNLYHRTDFVFIHWILSWFYLIYATVEVIWAIRKARSSVEKKQFYPLLWFIVPPVIASLLQMVVYGITASQCGMTLAALIIALNEMQDEISSDALTGLNNRRAMESAVLEWLRRGNVKMTFLMCDIDGFKNINDTLGHSAGDLVLRQIAGVLKKVCATEERSLILCRYGGDEFVICGTDMESHNTNGLIIKIEDSMRLISEEYGNSLNVSISVGDASGICNTYEDVEELINMADAKMYASKQKVR